jgi:hypothetical protein
MSRSIFAVACLLLLLPSIPLLCATDEASIKADTSGLGDRFDVSKHRYDAGKRRYVLNLVAKETSERPCHYEASFQDADDKEVTTVRLEFEGSGQRTEKGDKYTAYIKYPTRKTLEKVTQIVIKKSD